MRSSAVSDARRAVTLNALALDMMTRRFCTCIASRMDIAFRPFRNFEWVLLDADFFEADCDDFLLRRTGLICFVGDMVGYIIPQKEAGRFS
jgi:hypothetical protein